MKNELKRVHRLKIAAQVFLLGSSLLLCVSAGAQVNLLKNGDFESAPIGVGSPTTNWSVLYLKGCPDDWEIKDRTRSASIRSAWYGAQFRPRTQKPIHACFTQTVTGLTQTNHQYTVDGQMWAERADKSQFVVYIEAIGGTGGLLPDGRRSLLLTNVVDGTVHAKGTLDGNTPVFEEFMAKQTPDVNGKIEVRLHYHALTFRTYDKMWQEATYFDDISLYY
jgi:hypothetical protein